MYDDRPTIATSSDSEFIGVGDAFYLVFGNGSRDVEATITEIVCDGDVDGETGVAYGYVDGATFVLANGLTGEFGRDGTGTYNGESFDTQAQSSAYYAAYDAFREGKSLSYHQKGLLIAGIKIADGSPRVLDGRLSREQVVEIAKILGDIASFHYFDSLAGQGGRIAEEYGAYKVRQARNLSFDGNAVLFDTLTEIENGSRA